MIQAKQRASLLHYLCNYILQKYQTKDGEIIEKNNVFILYIFNNMFYFLPILRFMSTGAGLLPVLCETTFDCFNEGEGPREE